MTTTTSSTASMAAPRPPAAPRRASVGRRYGRMWANTPRELGYLALTALIGLLAFNIAAAVVGVGGGMLVVLGVVLLALVLLASRYVGGWELTRLRWARTKPIAAPSWPAAFAGKSPLRALGDVFANGHYWLYGLHTAVVNPILAGFTFTIWFGWAALGLLLATAPAWVWAVTTTGIPGAPDGQGLAVTLVWFGTRSHGPGAVAVALAGIAALGLLMLAVLPFVTRGMTLAHWGVARLLLARFRSEDLQGEVARVDAARVAAVTAEDTALRRLERDIHDGPQQRLLALQMELATAERRLGEDTTAAEPIATARRLATETLDELRALAQGFAPPLLQDRGLSAALGALGRRGAVPVETAIAVEGELPDAVERSVYFVAAELVTNAIKHAGASRIRLEARTTEEAGRRVLHLAVTDDGRGGARVVPGHGLEGVTGRLAGLGGTVTVTSPEGGPTTVAVTVPLA